MVLYAVCLFNPYVCTQHNIIFITYIWSRYRFSCTGPTWLGVFALGSMIQLLSLGAAMYRMVFTFIISIIVPCRHIKEGIYAILYIQHLTSNTNLGMKIKSQCFHLHMFATISRRGNFKCNVIPLFSTPYFKY